MWGHYTTGVYRNIVIPGGSHIIVSSHDRQVITDHLTLPSAKLINTCRHFRTNEMFFFVKHYFKIKVANKLLPELTLTHV